MYTNQNTRVCFCFAISMLLVELYVFCKYSNYPWVSSRQWDINLTVTVIYNSIAYFVYFVNEKFCVASLHYQSSYHTKIMFSQAHYYLSSLFCLLVNGQFFVICMEHLIYYFCSQDLSPSLQKINAENFNTTNAVIIFNESYLNIMIKFYNSNNFGSASKKVKWQSHCYPLFFLDSRS